MTAPPPRPNPDSDRTHRLWTRDEERVAARDELTDTQVAELTGRTPVAVAEKRRQLRSFRRPLWQE